MFQYNPTYNQLQSEKYWKKHIDNILAVRIIQNKIKYHYLITDCNFEIPYEDLEQPHSLGDMTGEYIGHRPMEEQIQLILKGISSAENVVVTIYADSPIIYLAGPFFNDKQRTHISQAENTLRKRGLTVFSPREHSIPDGENMANHLWGKAVFQMDVEAIDFCDLVVAVYDGMYSDTGTAWEIGYAYANNIPIVLVCTDVSNEQSIMPVNASVAVLDGIERLDGYDFSKLESTITINNQK